MRELFYQNDSLGIIGEDTGFKTHTMGSTLKVGDVISFYRFEEIYTKVVTKDPNFGNGCGRDYGVFGFGSDHFNFDNITRILHYDDLTEDIFQKLNEPMFEPKRSNFTIKEVEVEEMTLSEIEKELGRRIKVVAEEGAPF